MKVFENRILLFFIIIITSIIFLISIWSIAFDDQWIQGIMAVYGILLIITLAIVFYILNKKSDDVKQAVEKFEKSLEGKLHHFKCPSCNGIFAIKKSKRDNKKSFSLTCPDCGYFGTIPHMPKLVVEEIPDEKSVKTKFTCKKCGEFISIWAEGTDIIENLRIYSCPYCGKNQTMNVS